MKKTQFGYTLIELMVVVSIIGVLAAVVIASLNDARGSAKVAAAQVELKSIAEGSLRLQLDTSRAPGGFPSSVCSGSTQRSDGNGIDVNDINAGLVQPNVAKYPAWNGPYIQAVNDPWGRPYVLDSHYRCTAGETAVQSGQCDAGQWYRVIYSRGENGSPYQSYDADNVAYVICKRD